MDTPQAGETRQVSNGATLSSKTPPCAITASGVRILSVLRCGSDSTRLRVQGPAAARLHDILARVDWAGAARLVDTPHTRPVAVRIESLDPYARGSVLQLGRDGPRRTEVSLGVALALCARGCRTVVARSARPTASSE